MRPGGAGHHTFSLSPSHSSLISRDEQPSAGPTPEAPRDAVPPAIFESLTIEGNFHGRTAPACAALLITVGK